MGGTNRVVEVLPNAPRVKLHLTQGSHNLEGLTLHVRPEACCPDSPILGVQCPFAQEPERVNTPDFWKKWVLQKCASSEYIAQRGAAKLSQPR